MELSAPGPHALLLILKPGKLTAEERMSLEWIGSVCWAQRPQTPHSSSSPHLSDQLRNKPTHSFLQESRELWETCGFVRAEFTHWITQRADRSAQVSELLQKLEVPGAGETRGNWYMCERRFLEEKDQKRGRGEEKEKKRERGEEEKEKRKKKQEEEERREFCTSGPGPIRSARVSVTCAGLGPPDLHEEDDDGEQMRHVTGQTEHVHPRALMSNKTGNKKEITMIKILELIADFDQTSLRPGVTTRVLLVKLVLDKMRR
ncbi:hypothetical protein Baya_17001 [Bagarius yarrelli]|uniref:Uncharacterized protein n=1 Tax=Bagarius yarrelli TaxID=175774 RepID=A0A556VX18_BAGYA|nr:hypothetical protein Baya_17001 [Bagarius yarrelli]